MNYCDGAQLLYYFPPSIAQTAAPHKPRLPPPACRCSSPSPRVLTNPAGCDILKVPLLECHHIVFSRCVEPFACKGCIMDSRQPPSVPGVNPGRGRLFLFACGGLPQGP
jgi:hypothetical protein